MTLIRLALMLYFFIVAHTAACQTLSKAYKVYKDMVEVLLLLEIFITEDSLVENLRCKYIIIIIIIIYPFTATVVGAPQMTSQPVSSIVPCFQLPSGTCQTPGLSIP